MLISTSSYYNESNHPILVAKVKANSEWRSRVRARARDYTEYCDSAVLATLSHTLLLDFYPNFDPEWGYCGEILPSFMKAKEQILQATSEILPEYTYKIGYIVIPHNMTDYEMILDEVMHRDFSIYHNTVDSRHRDDYVLDIIRLDKAAQYGYNLTTPDTLGAPWSPNGRLIWDVFGENGDIFADDENWILLVNFELDFLELSRVCVRYACSEVPPTKTALLELGEESLWGGPDFLEGGGRESEVQGLLSNAISAFMDQTSFSNQHLLLRAVVLTGGASPVVLTGGASPVAMDSLRSALSNALPFLEEWRFKTSIIDPAFVASLGAALRIRNEVLGERNYRDNRL